MRRVRRFGCTGLTAQALAQIALRRPEQPSRERPVPLPRSLELLFAHVVVGLIINWNLVVIVLARQYEGRWAAWSLSAWVLALAVHLVAYRWRDTLRRHRPADDGTTRRRHPLPATTRSAAASRQLR